MCIGVTIRCIRGKAILCIIGPEIQEAPGSSQLCAGQESGCGAAVHAMQKIFKDENSKAILQVDAYNVFNCLYRQSTLKNIQVLCPSWATVVINTYRSSPEAFIDGETIISQEGTTKGNLSLWACLHLGILPLIKQLDHLSHQLLCKRKGPAVGKWSGRASHCGKDSSSGDLCSIYTCYGQQIDIPYENCRSHTIGATATWECYQTASATS